MYKSCFQENAARLEYKFASRLINVNRKCNFFCKPAWRQVHTPHTFQRWHILGTNGCLICCSNICCFVVNSLLDTWFVDPFNLNHWNWAIKDYFRKCGKLSGIKFWQNLRNFCVNLCYLNIFFFKCFEIFNVCVCVSEVTHLVLELPNTSLHSLIFWHNITLSSPILYIINNIHLWPPK